MAHFKENYFFWTKFCWAHGKTFLAFGYVFSSRIDEIFFYLSKKTIWGIFFLGKKYKMLTFSHTDWKNFGQLLNLFCEISKLYSTWTDVHFEPKRKLGKKFFYRFRILLEKNVWRDFQKDILLVQRNTFWIIAFFWKLELFSHFCRQRKKGSAFRQKFSRHDCHNCILHVYWNPLRKKLQFGKHLRLFTLFWQGATISVPAAKSSIMVAKIAFLVPIGTLWEKFFFEQNIFVTLSCSYNERNFFGFMAEYFWLLAILFQQDWQNCPLLVLKNSSRQFLFFSEGKIYFLTFSDTDWKKFGHLRKFPGRVCQDCFLCVQRNTSGIDVLFEKLCFPLQLLGHWVKKFQHYGNVFLAFWL